jgi:glucose-6-phosphate dehydrogenase assembly protein OpcA
MSQLLENTTSAAVGNAISAERHKMGATATGMVLTFIIVTDELHQSEATRAATYAANQHPCRILVVIPRPGRGKSQLDAEIWVGDREGLGETVKLRLKGPLAHQEASVVLPLLLADTPVVVWWPANAPKVPAEDPVGRLANRRVTDAAFTNRPLIALENRTTSYHPGDTDLAWTRTTPWRSMMATALDEPHETIISGSVASERNSVSARLLAGWLQAKLRVPVKVRNSKGPGITSVTLETTDGPIELARPDGEMATLTRSRGVTRKIPLLRREMRDLVSEELRRLDADEIYAEALAEVSAGLGRDDVKKDSRHGTPGRVDKKTARGTNGQPHRARKGKSVPMTPSEEEAKSGSNFGTTEDRPTELATARKAPAKATAKKPAKKKAAAKKAAVKRPTRKRTAKKSEQAAETSPVADQA